LFSERRQENEESGRYYSRFALTRTENTIDEDGESSERSEKMRTGLTDSKKSVRFSLDWDDDLSRSKKPYEPIENS
jgi:hypothetical protein